MRKEMYENPEIEVVEIKTEDVLLASGCGGAGCLTETGEDEA